MNFTNKKDKKDKFDFKKEGISPDDSMKDSWSKPITAKPLKPEDVQKKLMGMVMDRLKDKGITPNSSIEDMEEFMRKNNIPLPDRKTMEKTRSVKEVKSYVTGQVDCLNSLGKSIADSASEIGADLDEVAFSRRDVIIMISDALDVVIEFGKKKVKEYEEDEARRKK